MFIFPYTLSSLQWRRWMQCCCCIVEVYCEYNGTWSSLSYYYWYHFYGPSDATCDVETIRQHHYLPPQKEKEKKNYPADSWFSWSCHRKAKRVKSQRKFMAEYRYDDGDRMPATRSVLTGMRHYVVSRGGRSLRQGWGERPTGGNYRFLECWELL